MLPFSASTRALSPSSEAEKQRSSFVPKENGSIIFVLFWITPRSESPVTKMVDLPEKETSNSETPGYSKLAKGLSLEKAKTYVLEYSLPEEEPATATAAYFPSSDKAMSMI